MERAASIMALLMVVAAAGCVPAPERAEPTSTSSPDFVVTTEGVLTVNVFVEAPCLTPSPLGDSVESNLGSFRHLQFATRVLQIDDEFEVSEAASFSLTNRGAAPITIFVKDSLAYEFARSREDFGFDAPTPMMRIAVLTVRDATRNVGLHKRQLLPAEQATVDVHTLVPGGFAANAFEQATDDPAQLEVWKADLRSTVNELMGKSLQTSVVVRAECDEQA